MTPQISTALLKTQSDARLAQLVAAGQERAFDAIVARYERPLRRYCQRMLSEGLADDVVQQAFLTLWSQLRGGNEIRELRPWLYRVAHNAALNTIKRAGYHYEQLDETIRSDDAPDAVLERSTAMRSTIDALHALPERQREALVRTAIDGESRTVVALDLGLTDGAVGQLLHRARATLRAAATAITPFPLIAWLAGKHAAAGVPHLVHIAGAKSGAGASGAASATSGAGATSGTVGAGSATAGAGATTAGAGATAGVGGAGAATAAAGTASVAGGISVGTTAGLASIALKGAALVAVGLAAAATPVVAQHALSGSPRAAADIVAGGDGPSRSTPLKLAGPIGPVTTADFTTPEQPTGADATPTDTTATDATSADQATDTSTEPTAAAATDTSTDTNTDTTPTDTTSTDTSTDTTPTDTTPTDTTPTDTTPAPTDTTPPPTDTTPAASTSSADPNAVPTPDSTAAPAPSPTPPPVP